MGDSDPEELRKRAVPMLFEIRQQTGERHGVVTTSARSWNSPFRSRLLPLAEPAQQRQPWYVPEDAVVGDEWDVEPEGRSSDPAVGFVLLLAERVAAANAGRSELDVGGDKLGPGPDDAPSGESLFETLQPRRSLPGELGSEADLGHRDERDDEWSAFQQRTVARCERCATS